MTRIQWTSLVLLLSLSWTTLACSPAAEPARGDLGTQIATAIASGTETFDHSTFDSLLEAGTKDGLVRYNVFTERRRELDQYLASLASANLESLNRNHLLALLINAYNAYTIHAILENPGVASIRDIDGVWDTTTHTVGGFEMTLDTIEHNLIRPYFKDPRIHVAVNCASISCAPLPPWAFDGSTIEAQLDEWTRAFFTNPKYCRRDQDTLRVSKLLDWYGSDFTQSDANPRADSIPEFIAAYAQGDVLELLERDGASTDVVFDDYDWSLNRVE